MALNHENEMQLINAEMKLNIGTQLKHGK